MYNAQWAVCSTIVMDDTEAKTQPTQNEGSKVFGRIVLGNTKSFQGNASASVARCNQCATLRNTLHLFHVLLHDST